MLYIYIYIYICIYTLPQAQLYVGGEVEAMAR